jgi:flagellar basal-body rod protein FlgB
MLARMVDNLEFQGQALTLRAQRQQVLASNIANADTPGFQARDFDFASVLRQATGQGAPQRAGAALTDPRHLPAVAGAGGPRLEYRLPEQRSLDGNTVDLDSERANFADNSVRYEATLRFIDGSVRTMLSAIRGE